jgi:hypothetical protein
VELDLIKHGGDIREIVGEAAEEETIHRPA